MRSPRRIRRRYLRGMALIGALALVAGACGDDDEGGDDTSGDDGGDTTEQGGDDALAQWREDGVVMGIANERPYGFEEGGEATGEAPELAKVVFEELGIEDVTFQPLEFNALINGLNAGRVDVIAAGMFINPERAENVLFTDPDYCAPTAFAVPEGNPDDLSDYESVTEAGITLGTLGGAVEGDQAVESGVPEDQVEVIEGTPNLFDALDAGRVDAVALTAITVRAQVEDMDGFEVTEPFIPVIDGEEQLGCGGFGFRFEDQPLRDAFNEQINTMKQNDEILPIIEEFGFTDAETSAAVDVTAADLAGGAYDDLDLGG
jgi:polar amino acid transport system substrate-binding protein